MISKLLLCIVSRGAAAEQVTQDDLQLLLQWKDRLHEDLAEIRTATGYCSKDTLSQVQSGCEGTTGACRVVVRQTVQRFGSFTDSIADGDVDINFRALVGALAAERQELEGKQELLQQLTVFLNGNEASDDLQPFTHIEIEEQLAQARMVAAQPQDGRVEVWVEKGGTNGTTDSCIGALLIKPKSMWYDAAPAIVSPSILPSTDMTRPLMLDGALHSNSTSNRTWNHVLHRWVANNTGLTWAFTLLPCSQVWMMPCFGSGPEMPEAEPSCGGSGGMRSYLSMQYPFGHAAVSSGSFVATPFMDDGLDCDPSQGLSYFDSSQYGPIGNCPGAARNFLWMSPIVGDICGFTPARQLPGRTISGSHPCGSSASGGRPDELYTLEQHTAPNGAASDSQLVEMLYASNAGGAQFGRVTFFTTTLSQLSVFGIQPRDTRMQHHGVQLTLLAGSPGMPLSRSPQEDETTEAPLEARVLTLDMMSDGLWWTLRNYELQPHELHSSETYDFDSISPAVVAEFLLSHRSAKYRDLNCQAFAQGLMDQILLKGFVESSFGPRHALDLGDAPDFTNRGYVVLGVVLLCCLLSPAVQASMMLRFFKHGWQAEKGGGWTSKGLLALDALNTDVCAFERKVASKVGCRVAFLVKVALVVSFQPLFWRNVFGALSGILPARFQGGIFGPAPKVCSEPLLAD